MRTREVASGAAAGAAGMVFVGLARAAADGERALSRGIFQPPPPAQLGAGILKGGDLLKPITGRLAARRRSGLLNIPIHFLYGPAAGIAYAAGRRQLRAPTATTALFGGIWVIRLAALPALGLRKPFWCYSVRENVIDGGYHATYALGVAAAYATLRRAAIDKADVPPSAPPPSP